MLWKTPKEHKRSKPKQEQQTRNIKQIKGKHQPPIQSYNSTAKYRKGKAKTRSIKTHTKAKRKIMNHMIKPYKNILIFQHLKGTQQMHCQIHIDKATALILLIKHIKK
jgi:hypothetical protein